MKKLSALICIIMAFSALFAFTACTEKENGVTIKYATFTFNFTDKNDKARTENVTVKLYTNYAPKATQRVIDLINNNFYNGTVVNTIESSWISFGGYTEENGILTEVFSGEDVYGEFSANGWVGNKLTITKGSVIMYRDRTNANGNNYNTANCRLAICTSSAAPFTANNYCIIGKIEDAAQLSMLEDITALRYKTTESEDGDVTVYNRYYVGGVDTIAKKYLNEDGTVNAAGDEKGLLLEDINKAIEGGELYRTAGPIDDEAFDDYYEAAYPFISAIGSATYEYFYTLPYNGMIKVSAAKVTNNK